MSLDIGWQSEVKTRAARRVVLSPQAAAMRFDDVPADAQSHAGAMKLGGKERIENLIRLLRGQPHAGIADGHENFLVIQQARNDEESPRPIYTLHRIDAVHDQVH